ncbi:hypothetical protein DOK67_0001311 [Enterococcus sp. DIV0212c]|uniref:ABC transporter domain-containing protein n=1 Tax=Enterococcus caccae ATCC BAA-1240 TaxID=1158612 RepID=R3WRV3_9ENTE|nr:MULTISPECIES: ABC transporter ATP-binding protein [Enterococcus]EOL50581.1 hypothetical protein UC7_00354 [Enterococcus caccae ATCC BAA-1240]EOT59203.1 hypothetical protein I580_02235 [Enterococcus caccae ATCC BAA-1240]
MQKIITAEQLCKEYNNGSNTVKVLKNIDLEIYEGDFTVIMGSSGSGKSTLLYCLSAMDSISSGEVKYQDQRMNNMNEVAISKIRRTEMGFVFQQMNLISTLSLFENIIISGYLKKESKKTVHSNAMSLLSQVGLDTFAKRLPSEISGGQQQRVAIARALINSPKILFADEPTGALNSKSGKNILDTLSHYNNNDNQTILMVTHDLKASLRANRIIYLNDGEIEGELALDKYAAENIDMVEREKNVLNWLQGMGW